MINNIYNYCLSVIPLHVIFLALHNKQFIQDDERMKEVEDDVCDEQEYEHVSLELCEPTLYETTSALWIHSYYYTHFYGAQFMKTLEEWSRQTPPFPLHVDII